MPTTSIPITREVALWRSLVALLISATVFDLLFWDQYIGINLPLYGLMISGALLGRYGWRGLSAPARAVLGGLLICCAMVAIHNSVVSIVAAFACLFVFAALAHEAELRSLFYGIGQVFANYALLLPGGSRSIGEALEGRRVPRVGWRWFRLAAIPVILVVVYFQIYRVANPKFDSLTAGFLDKIGAWLGDLFAEVLTPHTLFFLFALFLSAGLLFRFAPRWLAQHEAQWPERLVRRREKRPHWLAPLSMNALEQERNAGLILLVMMNVLLLVVNAVDISWIWWGFEVPEGFSLKQFVHEGTWLLIISILLSMAIMLRLFRGNQNFHSKNAPLRALAYTWIAQNFILGISVFIRNYHYINFHGLAYKRIGMVVFLALVMIGLITLLLKIRRLHGLFHLLRVNAWAAFAALVGLTVVNWDGVITRYNLGHWNKGEIDVDNYLAMSDKVLPLLYGDVEKVRQQMSKHRENEVRWVTQLDPEVFDIELDRRKELFMERYADQDWQSWNWADERTHRALLALDEKTN